MAHEQNDVDDAASWLQVSISPQQTKLISPRTPAIDKAQALQNSQDFFGSRFGEDIHDAVLGDVTAGTADTDLYHASGTSNEAARSDNARAVLREGFQSRRRASSGPERAFENIQRAIMSLPKKLSLSTQQSTPVRSEEPVLQPSNAAELPAHYSNATTTHSQITAPHAHRQESTKQQPGSRRDDSNDMTAELPGRPQLQRLKSGGSSLRKSYSDESLAVSRTFSQASSLGDDSRFEHIQNQVNSRLKAIRDSWQDSTIKMPSFSSFKPDMFRGDDSSRMPSLSSLRPDFLRGHTPSRSIDATTKTVDPMTRQPFQSLDTMSSDIKRSGHSFLDQALDALEGDVIVLGGYRGSVLRSAKPPHKQLWVPIKVGLNLRKVDLEVGIDPEDDHKPADNVIADGMLNHIGPVDISARLLRRLRACANAQSGKLRVHDYGYDWRLDPNFLSKQLSGFVSRLQGKVTVIAHSLGGLITRHAVNHRPELFAGVVFAGVPTRCVNILGPLRNGDDVLLSSRVLTAQVNFTIRTSFALLPLDGKCFIDKHTKEEYLVDFFDANTWRDYRLSPCMGRALPALKTESNGIASYVSNVAKSLPTLPLSSRKAKLGSAVSVNDVAEPDGSAMTRSTVSETSESADPEPIETVPSTVVTISPDAAYEYLSRALASVKQFKQELAFRPELAERYPPIAAIYGKNTPTVVGARVVGREGIKRADAYDDLTFGSGDGVVLARAAMPPPGYKVARGGLISSDRGHVSLLGDLDAVGKALLAIRAS